MTGESYIIKYESMSQFYNYVSIKIDEWYTALSEWDTAYNELVNMECFQGKAAETAKTYLQEIHGPLLYALTSALQAYQTSFLLYKNGFYGIDGHIYSSIPQEILVFLRDVLKTENTQLDTISTSIQTSLNSVSDIFPLSNPTKYVLESTIEGVKNELTAFDSQIDSYEESQYTTLKGDLQALLDSLQTTIDNYLINGTNVVSYVPGTYCGNISVLDLYDKVEVSNAYIANNQEAITSAYEKHLEVYDQMVADYVAQMAEQRKDQGVAKIVGGVVAVTIGIGAIVCTAGAATPVVVSIVGGVAGTCSTAYGLSNMVEGGFDIYYGSIGDITTEAFNPIRDTYFCGNQELYDAWGSLSMTTAGMMWQAGKLPSSISGITTAVAKEAGEDFIYDTTSGLMTNYAAEQWDLNVSESTALNIGLNIGLSLAGGTVSNKFDNFINQATPLPKPDAPNASNIGEWAFAGNEHINVGDVTTNASVSINAGNVVADGMPANVGGGVNIGNATTVKDIINDVENGDIPLTNNIQKGNYGEMKMDEYFESQGYERISLDTVTDINTPTHQGIDGVYYNPDGHPPYIIGEAKYGSSRLSTLADRTPQMSVEWIEGGKGTPRLELNVGKSVADDILLEGYDSVLVNIDKDGNVITHMLDENGQIIK